MNALITDITGQDGACLAELLIAKGCTMYDVFHHTSPVNFLAYARMEHYQAPEPSRTRSAEFRLRVFRSVLKIRFYQAGTSEMFGKVQTIPQDESTPFYLRSP